MAGFAFVDDTDLIVTDETNEEIQVARKMQESLNLWHRLLQATGGNLVPEKCFWYLINFRWEHTHWKYVKWQEDDQTLSIACSDGSKVKIPCLDMSNTRQTLGVRLAPDGNNKAEFLHLQEETLKWKQHMLSTKLSRSAANFGI